MPDLILRGVLVDRGDFNRGTSPYQSVRPSGLAGSCFAFFYRPGAQYLLMLKKDAKKEQTVEWYPLAPVNEQLHSDDDPWLLWVRGQSRKGAVGRP